MRTQYGLTKAIAAAAILTMATGFALAQSGGSGGGGSSGGGASSSGGAASGGARGSGSTTPGGSAISPNRQIAPRPTTPTAPSRSDARTPTTLDPGTQGDAAGSQPATDSSGTGIPPASGSAAAGSATGDKGAGAAPAGRPSTLPNQTTTKQEQLTGGGTARQGARGHDMESCMNAWDVKTHLTKARWREICARTLREKLGR